MAVLVTGGAGYIGSHMVYALADAGEEVVVLDNLTTGFWWAIAPAARLVEGDIGDETLLAQLAKDHKFDAIIHFAGSIVVPESVSDPLAYYLNNTVKTRSLIAAAVKAQIPRFVFSSTAAVYGNPQSVPVKEDAMLAPISPYGSSKLMSEWMLRDSHAAYGLQYVAEEVPWEHVHRYGVVKPGTWSGKAFTIEAMVEKPKREAAPSNLIISGRYILQPEIFAEIEKQEPGAGGEIQITDAMIRLQARQKFSGLKFTGKTYDCGDKIGFLTANVAYGLARDDLSAAFKRELKGIIDDAGGLS